MMKTICFVISLVLFIIATIYLFKSKYIKGNKKSKTFKQSERFIMRIIYMLIGLS